MPVDIIFCTIQQFVLTQKPHFTLYVLYIFKLNVTLTLGIWSGHDPFFVYYFFCLIFRLALDIFDLSI